MSDSSPKTPSRVDLLIPAFAGFTETALSLMQTAMGTFQSTLETFAGMPPRTAPSAPPLDGPKDLDSALAELLNRCYIIARYTSADPIEIERSARELWNAVTVCFRHLDFKDPRNLILPFQLPLSAGTLLAELSLRGLTSYQAVGSKRYLRSALDLLESLSDFHVYLSLQYVQVIENRIKHLERNPRDSSARLELGRTYIKCGLFREALEQLKLAAEDPSVRALALHEASVAHHRLGKYGEAIEAGSAALSADPSSERTRVWMWLSAHKLGGYPPDVRNDHHMEITAGF